ncbi:hypothetical protein F9U64_14075 [Gracilibacillus oryzae]|uniref:Uncharacterized protein n=1 Tax=Gracilibacillus oryzae TaxID=1672701 RepID=A0A7C8KRH3_9BACI|nr:hypothetical protein [Gracilibacillus oryzae]KAB8130753.1 hypothetical protein F9U64_14075 [Gracilibacillus oryzae]
MDEVLKFHKKDINNSNNTESAFQVFLEENLIAEVRGTNPNQFTVIPMRQLDGYKEDKLDEYIVKVLSSE